MCHNHTGSKFQDPFPLPVVLTHNKIQVAKHPRNMALATTTSARMRHDFAQEIRYVACDVAGKVVAGSDNDRREVIKVERTTADPASLGERKPRCDRIGCRRWPE